MPQSRRKHRLVAGELRAARARRQFPRVADAPDETQTPSPALVLQERLSDAWSAPPLAEATERRWSPRATLILGGGISLGLWAAIAAAIAAVLH